MSSLIKNLATFQFHRVPAWDRSGFITVHRVSDIRNALLWNSWLETGMNLNTLTQPERRRGRLFNTETLLWQHQTGWLPKKTHHACSEHVSPLSVYRPLQLWRTSFSVWSFVYNLHVLWFKHLHFKIKRSEPLFPITAPASAGVSAEKINFPLAIGLIGSWTWQLAT